MSGVLGPNEYGLRRRIVQPVPGSADDSHELVVTVRLKGDMRPAYLHGEQHEHLDQQALQDLISSVAAACGPATIEELGVSLARQLVHQPSVHEVTVQIEEGTPEHGNSRGRRFVEVVDLGWRATVEAGILGLNPAALSGRAAPQGQSPSQWFTAHWRYGRTDVDWEQVYQSVAAALVRQLAGTAPATDYQVIFEAASAVLDRHTCISQVSLSFAVSPGPAPALVRHAEPADRPVPAGPVDVDSDFATAAVFRQ
ncbi:hypothetical protein [Jatrophihabitans sp.]|uniref:hypothetical protein n=1 Tax=Jatrophihabitans sp. TaxID=1932789 RepID=UPI002EDDD450